MLGWGLFGVLESIHVISCVGEVGLKSFDSCRQCSEGGGDFLLGRVCSVCVYVGLLARCGVC